MKTFLILVGKTSDIHLSALIEDYLHRISYYFSLSVITLPVLRARESLSQNEIREKEGALILRQITPSSHLILLDERGKMFSSIDFANYMVKKQISCRELFFVIGGAYGFSQSVYQRADELLSLSKMTFSHQMARLLFVEQIYRAVTIQNNHPYHH